MPAKKYHVALTDEERASLEQMLHRGQHSARKLTRARILLKADDGLDDLAISEEVQTSRPTVERTRRRFTELRLEALAERPRPGRTPILNEKGEARLIAEACSQAPEGRERWTLELLAGRVLTLKLAESCSPDTVGRVLKKTNSSPGSNSSGACRRSAGPLSPQWKMCWHSMPSRMIRCARRSTLMRPRANCSLTSKRRNQRHRDSRSAPITSTNAKGRAIFSFIVSHRRASAMWL